MKTKQAINHKLFKKEGVGSLVIVALVSLSMMLTPVAFAAEIVSTTVDRQTAVPVTNALSKEVQTAKQESEVPQQSLGEFSPLERADAHVDQVSKTDVFGAGDDETPDGDVTPRFFGAPGLPGHGRPWPDPTIISPEQQFQKDLRLKAGKLLLKPVPRMDLAESNDVFRSNLGNPDGLPPEPPEEPTTSTSLWLIPENYWVLEKAKEFLGVIRRALSVEVEDTSEGGMGSGLYI